MMDEVVVNGVPLCASYGLILQSVTETGPDAKTYSLDIPGGNGALDLTEAISGDVTFSNRSFDFTFVFGDGRGEFSHLLTDLRSFLHGRKLAFSLSWDGGYEYYGRFSVREPNRVARSAGIITVSADVEPYKLRETCTYRVNAAGGIVITLESGRMPVCPTFEFSSETIVACGDAYTQMQPGSYKVNDIWLHEGINELYINSYLGDGNVSAKRYAGDTIESHAKARISDLIWDGVRGAALAIEEWVNDTISLHSAERIIDTAHAVNTDTETFAVYVNYDWKDL